MKPYQMTAQEVAQHYGTDLQRGLTKEQVQEQLKKYGTNALPEPPHDSLFFVFLHQFQNPLIYILLIAASIIFFTGNRLDAFIISGVLFFNAIIGTIQEGRTHALLDSLRTFIVSNSIVIRDGKKDIILDEQLVVGDLIILQSGERVPADSRLIEADNLIIDESILTGESAPITKITDWFEEGLVLADQKNMIFRGTYVLAGSGKAVVVATGGSTEIGRLQKAAEEIEIETPIKRELDALSGIILLFILGICLILLLIGLWYGKPFADLLVMLTALFICVVPEGLPVVLTLVLVTGAYRMAQQRVLVKRLQGVDALGRTEIAIIDKTGTLTRNEMVVNTAWTDGKRYDIAGVGYFVQGSISCKGDPIDPVQIPSLCLMGIMGSLMSHVEIKYHEERNMFTIEGDPTEAALYIFSQKLGYKRENLEKSYRVIKDMPFNAQTRMHITFCEYNGKKIALVLGSPEHVLDRCDQVDPAVRNELNRMLDEGLRVVAAAKKEYSGEPHEQVVSQGATFVGFYGIQDSIRPEVALVVRKARDAGLRVIMATGDHKKTAMYVARSVSIFQEGDEVIDGSEFDQLSQEELLRRIYKTTVYSRLTPDDKLRLITLFQKLGKVVAMTGDGVNDAPSLVAADVGIAMGRIGTEVAKQAADVILLDDSFDHIINAIEQGRHIFYALRRVILYFFATNLDEVFVVLFALSLNLPLPILAAQILWLNLVTDGFLDIALAMEPQEKDLLRRKWLKKGARLVDGTLLLKTVYMALPMGIGSLFIFTQYYDQGLAKARTMTLITMAMYQWFNAWNCRSETKSIVQIGIFSNKWLLLATSCVAFLQLLVVHVPFLQILFHTVPLTGHEFAVIIAVTVPLFVIEELRKIMVRIFWR